MPQEARLERFTFWRSYAETLDLLPEQERLALLSAIVAFGLDGKEPNAQAFSVPQQIAWRMISENLASTRAKAEAGSRGGKQKVSNLLAEAKQDASKPLADGKQTSSSLLADGKQASSKPLAEAKQDATTMTKTMTLTETKTSAEGGSNGYCVEGWQ